MPSASFSFKGGASVADPEGGEISPSKKEILENEYKNRRKNVICTKLSINIFWGWTPIPPYPTVSLPKLSLWIRFCGAILLKMTMLKGPREV